MPFRRLGELRIYQFDSLGDPRLIHAVFTREGGVSPDPWRGLNVGGTVGDNPARVAHNRRLAFESLGRDPDSRYDVWQAHTGRALVVEAPHLGPPFEQADAVLTQDPAVTLFMRFADCVPILLFDRERAAVGLVHSGWKGTVHRVAAAAVQSMRRSFGSNPEDILAGLGPAIAAHHYPVGPEVEEQVRASLGRQAEAVLQPRNGVVHLDLWAANRALLAGEGVTSVEVAGLCTACDTRLWFSHRGEGGRSGRFGALIALTG